MYTYILNGDIINLIHMCLCVMSMLAYIYVELSLDHIFEYSYSYFIRYLSGKATIKNSIHLGSFPLGSC